MRFPSTLFALLAAVLLGAPSFAIAQSHLCLDSGAVPIDTITASTTFGTSQSSGSLSRFADLGTNGSQSTGDLVWTVIVTQLTSGQINYSIDASSVTYSGGSDIDGIATGPLFSLMAQVTVRQGIALGYTPCSSLCTVVESATVSQAACVERTGTGSSTHFTPCADDCAFRGYAVCCQDPNPIVSLVETGAGACSGTCESTYTGEWQDEFPTIIE